MNRRQAIGALGLAAVASLPAVVSDRERFPGIYRVVSWKTTNPDGTVVEPLGANPIGRITYHKSGYMMSMRCDRTPPVRINPQTANIEVLREEVRRAQGAASGFVAYMGTFEVQEDRSIVIHHLEGGSSPNFAGARFERRYEFTSKGLNLSVPANFNTRLEWERVGDA